MTSLCKNQFSMRDSRKFTVQVSTGYIMCISLRNTAPNRILKYFGTLLSAILGDAKCALAITKKNLTQSAFSSVSVRSPHVAVNILVSHRNCVLYINVFQIRRLQQSTRF
jgi:hypothetical protein